MKWIFSLVIGFSLHANAQSFLENYTAKTFARVWTENQQSPKKLLEWLKPTLDEKNYSELQKEVTGLTSLQTLTFDSTTQTFTYAGKTKIQMLSAIQRKFKIDGKTLSLPLKFELGKEIEKFNPHLNPVKTGRFLILGTAWAGNSGEVGLLLGGWNGMGGAAELPGKIKYQPSALDKLIRMVSENAVGRFFARDPIKYPDPPPAIDFEQFCKGPHAMMWTDKVSYKVFESGEVEVSNNGKLVVRAKKSGEAWKVLSGDSQKLQRHLERIALAHSYFANCKTEAEQKLSAHLLQQYVEPLKGGSEAGSSQSPN